MDTATTDGVTQTEAVVGDVETFLQEVLGAMPPEPREAKPGRPRILPALALWAGLLVCVLRGFGGQRAVWRLLSERQLWFYPRFPVSDEAVYRRLATAGTVPLAHLFAQVGSLLGARLAPSVDSRLAPFASEVVVLDETALDPLARRLPTLRDLPATDTRRLPGKLAAVFDLRRQLFRHVEHHPNPHQREQVGARGLLAQVAPGALILADLGDVGFAWFDDLTSQGFFWLSRLRAKTSYTVIHPFYHRGETFDGLVWLGAHTADRARHAVRLVQFRTPRGLHRYVTNVRDPHTLPPAQIARLYARRWDIELAFDLIKTHLGLHLFWSAKPVVVLQQVWAVLIIAQILQALRLEIAGRAGVDPVEVSLPLLVEYLPRLAYEGIDPVALFVTEGRRLGFIRPSRRTQPQAPHLPRDQITPAPADLILERTPRYARRNCGPRSTTPSAYAPH